MATCVRIFKKFGRLQQAKAKKYFRQLIEAIAFMHSKGYYHLDISLENILIDETKDCIKLCDFGLSRPCLPDNQPFPVSFRRGGKIGYMAPPEILACEPFQGNKADIFSLGVILFMFLTGSPPFKMASSKDACFQYMHSGQINFLLREWKLCDTVPLKARDLLCKIFTKSQNRISLNDIFNHPWLQAD